MVMLVILYQKVCQSRCLRSVGYWLPATSVPLVLVDSKWEVTNISGVRMTQYTVVDLSILLHVTINLHYRDLGTR